MNITIPIYVELHRDTYKVRPLFFASPVEHHEKLERVLHNLTAELRKLLRDLGREPRHDALARWTFSPDLDYHRHDIVIELRKRVARGRFLFVVFHTLGRRVAFTPALPDVWFELARGEQLLDRATEVLQSVFRQREKEEEEDFTPPEKLSLPGTAWITTLDLDIYPAQTLKKDDEERRASLGGDEEDLDGERELFRVARCLDSLYPDDLDRVLLREREVGELKRLLVASDRRPVLLLGSAMVGKTTLLHEYVWRQVHEREEPHKVRNYTWLLSPQRLISGMSYVGQWEKRLLAIVGEARKKDHILYFDDFLGLYYAGRTGQSSLCVADVLKPYIERREVRLVAEMTPEVFRVLRERDRGFADLFHVLPLTEPSPSEVLRILIAVQRQLEDQQRCRFGLDVLSSVIDLERRYIRHLAFPGKAALFLRRLAVKYRKHDITRLQVLEEFHLQSGLSLSFLDSREKLESAKVIEAMEVQVIGQPAALRACAEVVGIAKARLNDPSRPLAAFLFLGPTGVGKTQCAKALSTYLFGDSEKLLRFDMNEYTEPGSAARLVGTFYQPEGLLTSAIRRQPFGVVLLDEIEKADPEVFDLLLQVLGEGRLTDALGRTADFCNAIIILTSNLGVREASATMGYGAGDGHNRDAYTNAAEKFFRPEFFNRLDRVIAFERLSREDVARIARILLGDFLKREGLVRRKCLLRVEPAALERIVDQGFDPVLGARALKRALERQLTQPVSSCLAGGIPEGLTVIHVYLKGDGLGVDVRTVEQVESVPTRERAEALLTNRSLFMERARAALRRIEERFASMRPAGEITATSLEGEHLIYFTIHEYLRGLWERLHHMSEQMESERRAAQKISGYAVSPDVRARKTSNLSPSKVDHERLKRFLNDLAAAQDIRLFLEEMTSQAVPLTRRSTMNWPYPLQDFALAELLAECCVHPQPEQVVLFGWSTHEGSQDWIAEVLGIIAEAIPRTQGNDLNWPKDRKPSVGFLYVLRGPTAWALAKIEEGTHLVCPKHGSLVPVQVHVWELPTGEDALEFIDRKMEVRRHWQEQLSRGEATVDDDPLPLGRVIRIYNEGNSMIDLRTGLVEGNFGPLLPLMAATLPLPSELLHE